MRSFVVCAVCLLIPMVVFALPNRDVSRKTAKQVSIEKEMVEAARKGYESAIALYRGDKVSVDIVVDSSQMLLEAELQRANTLENKLLAIDSGIERASELEERAKARLDRGTETMAAYCAAKFHHLNLQRLRESGTIQ